MFAYIAFIWADEDDGAIKGALISFNDSYNEENAGIAADSLDARDSRGGYVDCGRVVPDELVAAAG